MYISTKTYGHSEGLSCTFRQWRARSHCSLLHGYALAFRFTFASRDLDARNWVVDFGGLQELREALHEFFDHTLVVAKDDPYRDQLLALEDIARIIEMQDVGCEKFAEFAFRLATSIINSDPSYSGRVRVISCEVSEHEGNSAVYAEE